MQNISDKFISLMQGRKLWPPLNNYTFFGQGSAYQTKKYFEKYYPNLSPWHLIILAKDGESIEFLSHDSIEDCSRHIFALYLQGSPEMAERLGNFEKTEKYITELYAEWADHEILQNSIEGQLKFISAIRDRIWDLNASIMFVLFFDEEFCFEMITKHGIEISSEKFKSLWNLAINPAVESFDKSHRRHILKMIIDGRSKDYIQNHSRFILADFFGVAPIEKVTDYLENEYGAMSSTEAALELQKMDDELEKIKAGFEKWFATLTSEEQRIAWYIQRIIEFRDRRKNIFMQAYVIWWSVYENIFDEINLDHSLIPYVQFDELQRGVEYIASHRQEIEARKNGAALLIEYDGNITIEPINYAAAKQKLTDFYLQTTLGENTSQKIKGQTGAKGKIQGHVRIILDAKKENDFVEGDILVTGMTRPEFVPLMKKAGAIITDEGGITCHAAIVARELKKPCIIGTRIATQVLHDGDLIEVDADKGIVKIIK